MDNKPKEGVELPFYQKALLMLGVCIVQDPGSKGYVCDTIQTTDFDCPELDYDADYKSKTPGY